MTKTEMKKPLPTSQVSKANKVSTEAYKSPIDDSNKNSAEKPDSARDNIEKDSIEKGNIKKTTEQETKLPGAPETNRATLTPTLP